MAADLDLLLYREIKRLAIIGASEADLVTLARAYKIGKNTDISVPLSSAVAALRAKITVRAAQSEGREALTNSTALLMSGEFEFSSLEDCYFPDGPAEVTELVRLLVRARRQHCNSHHLYVRGQWHVRDRLVERGGGTDAVLQRSLAELAALY